MNAILCYDVPIGKAADDGIVGGRLRLLGVVGLRVRNYHVARWLLEDSNREFACWFKEGNCSVTVLQSDQRRDSEKVTRPVSAGLTACVIKQVKQERRINTCSEFGRCWR